MSAKSLLKMAATSSVVIALSAVSVGCVNTSGYNAYGEIYEDIYKDTDLYKKHKKTIETIDKDIYRPAIEQTAANKVSNMGYYVKEVKYKKGDRIIKVKAERGGEDYQIELSYPSYNVLKIKED